jgi:hypothetical protein
MELGLRERIYKIEPIKSPVPERRRIEQAAAAGGASKAAPRAERGAAKS